jgi:hypothetical protein
MTTPLRRSARLAEKANKPVEEVSNEVIHRIPKAIVYPPQPSYRKWRDLTAEEIKFDYELRLKLLEFAEQIRKDLGMARIREDFLKCMEKLDTLLDMSSDLIYEKGDEMFITDSKSWADQAVLGHEYHKWAIDSCKSYIKSLQNNISTPPTKISYISN